MNIELLHVHDCPNRTEARRNLDAALARVGIDAVVYERVVTSPELAVAMGMNGSPTILIDGIDPFGADASASLGCRLYRDATGVRGAPSIEALTARLAS
ncbi:MAG TPA: hypothetical protein VM262_08605 [Acidimicrobiales bacterium]|jgi:hypothetical protein|nr:hypothetical protein [Acidimicrobiales bacterium]